MSKHCNAAPLAYLVSLQTGGTKIGSTLRGLLGSARDAIKGRREGLPGAAERPGHVWENVSGILGSGNNIPLCANQCAQLEKAAVGSAS